MSKTRMTQVSDEKNPYGKPLQHDSKFKGPLEKRQCTDVICCLLFLAFVVGWIFIACFALINGNPVRLLHPTDSHGRICGKKDAEYDLSDEPRLFFFDLAKCISYSTVFDGCPTPQVCVHECPTDHYHIAESSFAILAASGDSHRKVKPYCYHRVRPKLTSHQELVDAVNANQCPRYWIPEKPFLDRCVPELILKPGEAALQAAVDIRSNLSDGTVPNATAVAMESRVVKGLLELKGVMENVFEDFERVWWIVVVMLLLAMIVSLAWIIIMRWFAQVLVWISIIGTILILAIGTAVLWYRWYELKYKQGGGNEFELTISLDSYWYMTKLILALAIIVSIMFVIVLLMLIFLRGRIRIAIALINESSRSLGHMMSALLFPLLPFILYVTAFGIWAILAAYLASTGKPKCIIASNFTGNETQAPTTCDCALAANESSGCQFVRYERSQYITWFQVYNLFGMFWLTCFISGLYQITLAGAFASYYWAFKKPRDIPAFPVFRSFWRAIRYHTGSIAFGSLILAIVRMLRVMLEYLDNKLKGSENSVAKAIMKCLRCLFWCFEKFLRFLTKNAYIMIAIHGKGFCHSGKEAFFLLMRNAVRVVVLDKVTDFVLLLGKLVIVAGIGVLSFYTIDGKWTFVREYTTDLHYYYVPLIAIIIGSYLICSAFFGVYEMAVDTTFLCFLEDEERNDGSEGRPYYMSKELKKILGKSQTKSV